MGIIKKSFTLIELLISVAIIALLLAPLFAIVFSIMRQHVVLVAYRDMLHEGNNVKNTIKHLLKERIVQITDESYLNDVCPLNTTPSPTVAPRLYSTDLAGNTIHIYQEDTGPRRIASDSASATYYLTTENVDISDIGFTCHRVNDYTPPLVQVSYTVSKSALYKDASFTYTFSTRIHTE